MSIYKTMLSYCLKCRKNTGSKNSKVARTKKRKNNVFLSSGMYDSKKNQNSSQSKKLTDY